jgi:NAD(P)-dependent dehydrogenase (short-subunit alcohol dehydrogenase family)
MDTKKVWLVTGASKGLGLSLVKKLLDKGYTVAATSRDKTALTQAIGMQHSGFLPLQVNLVDELSVTRAVAETIETFGRIDVLVNNAGYGQLGTIEELTDAEARQNFDINVFGALNVIRAVMPYLRAKQRGTIFNISSVGGFIGNFSGWGIYCATKFAVAGFTESLAAESKALGISATVVYPGYFRTEFLSKDSLNLPKNPIPAYADARAVQHKHENEIPGNQPGDPEKAAEALIEVSSSANPPLHLFLGQDAFDMAKLKIDIIQKDLVANETLSKSTGF